MKKKLKNFQVPSKNFELSRSEESFLNLKRFYFFIKNRETNLNLLLKKLLENINIYFLARLMYLVVKILKFQHFCNII